MSMDGGQTKVDFRVMGVVNVTPDSFSDGGLYLEPERALAHALELERQGAAILDIGGESTRPGADPCRPKELGRVLPVIEALVAQRAERRSRSTPPRRQSQGRRSMQARRSSTM